MILLALLALIASADCRVPMVGDNVRVQVDGIDYDGQVTNVTTYCLCLDVSEISSAGIDSVYRDVGDICFGWGQVIVAWPEDAMN